MTLQQKLLAKQSKKGFTLVELVVVIAILAILAAIAIPSVIGIIQNASQSATSTEAGELDRACKNFFALVKSGQVGKNSKNPDGSSVAVTTDLTSSDSARETAAKAATIEMAAKYAGINPKYDDCVYYTQTEAVAANVAAGTIVNKNVDGNARTDATGAVSKTVTLGTLYNGTVAGSP